MISLFSWVSGDIFRLQAKRSQNITFFIITSYLQHISLLLAGCSRSSSPGSPAMGSMMEINSRGYQGGDFLAEMYPLYIQDPNRDVVVLVEDGKIVSFANMIFSSIRTTILTFSNNRSKLHPLDICTL